MIHGRGHGRILFLHPWHQCLCWVQSTFLVQRAIYLLPIMRACSSCSIYPYFKNPFISVSHDNLCGIENCGKWRQIHLCGLCSDNLCVPAIGMTTVKLASDYYTSGAHSYTPSLGKLGWHTHCVLKLTLALSSVSAHSFRLPSFLDLFNFHLVV